MSDTRISSRISTCKTPLSLDVASQQAFADRQAKLVQGENWPCVHWYNDEDFCRAYNTAVGLYADNEWLQAELADARLALAVFSGAVNSFGLSEEQERQQARALKAIKGGRG